MRAHIESNPLCAQLCRSPRWCSGCPTYRECHDFCRAFTGDVNNKHPREDELREAYNAAVVAWKAANPSGVAPALKTRKKR